MNSSMVLTSDNLGRPVWVDTGWPACDERLITVAEVSTCRIDPK